MWIREHDPEAAETLKVYQVTPIPLSLGDVLPSLQTGIIDTVASSPIGTLALQWHTQVKYITELPLSYIVGVLAIDQKAFNKMDAPDQVVVREVMLRVFKDIDKQNRQDNLAAYDSLLKQGIKPIKPNPQELLEWQKSGGMATERIQKAGLISPAMLQVLYGHLKTFRTNQKS